MNYKRTSHIGIISGMAASCLSLLISLISNSQLIVSVEKALISFVIIWFLSQVVVITMAMLVYNTREQIKEEKRKKIIEEQKEKIESSENESAEKAKNSYKKISSDLQTKINKSKNSGETNKKGEKADFTVGDES